MKSTDILDTKQSVNPPENSVKVESPPEKTKKSKWIKIAIIILGILVIMAVITVFVVKYCFKDEDIYEVTDIKRDINSVEYFTENKKMTSKMAYTNGDLQESEQVIDTNFVVMVTDRKDLEDEDYLNKAGLIILDSKVHMEGKEAALDSLNIFDEEKMQEFEENENKENKKYPMAIFYFYKNGTIKEILLPENSDKNDIQNMEELINNVAPKLIRNKTEDEENDIKIIKRHNKNNIKSFTEIAKQKEYINKYTNTKFKGSKITKKIEREVEDEKLTEIRADTNLYLETEQKEEENYLDLGIKNFTFDMSSNIKAYERNETKGIKDLIKKVISKPFYQNSEYLMRKILEKEQEEQNKNITQESINTEKEPNAENRLRNLGYLGGYFEYEWTISTFNLLGADAKITYYVCLSGGRIVNYLKFEANSFNVKIGNIDGIFGNGNEISRGKDIPLFAFPLGPIEIFIRLGADITMGVNIRSDTNFSVKLSGSVYLKGGLGIGGGVARAEGGVRGNFISADFTTEYQYNDFSGRYNKNKINLVVNAGYIEIYAEAYVLWWKVVDLHYELWRGWSRTWNW